MRTRKVSERLVNGDLVIEKETKIYLGNYEIKRIHNESEDGETTILQRQTLRIMDDESCVATMHFWQQDDRQREVEKAETRKLRFQLDNHLGSVSLGVDDDAQVISYEEYFPYGGTAFIAGKSQKEVKLKEYRYSGKERDEATGLYYYGARYYAPWLGRWLNPDPAGTVDGLNMFGYTKNRPIIGIDSRGLKTSLSIETKSTISDENKAQLQSKIPSGSEIQDGALEKVTTKGIQKAGESEGDERHLVLFRGEKKEWWPEPKIRLISGVTIRNPNEIGANTIDRFRSIVGKIKANSGTNQQKKIEAFAQSLRANGKDWALATAAKVDGSYKSDYNYELKIMNVRTFYWGENYSIGEEFILTGNETKEDYIVMNASTIEDSTILGFGHKTETGEVTFFQDLSIDNVINVNNVLISKVGILGKEDLSYEQKINNGKLLR